MTTIKITATDNGPYLIKGPASQPSLQACRVPSTCGGGPKRHRGFTRA
jgi:hypothetical protein